MSDEDYVESPYAGDDRVSRNALIEAMDIPLPPSVISAIKSAPNRGIFNVVGLVEFPDQILKCDRLDFDKGGCIHLNAIDGTRFSWVAVVAREWFFRGPEHTNWLARSPSLIGPPGLNAPDALRGADGVAYGQAGGAGANGSAGADAGPGVHLSTLFVFGERVLTDPPTPAPISHIKLVIDVRGVRGGKGGRGGRGGDGGTGKYGNPGQDGDLFRECKQGPGNGGDGGPGGTGGIGGMGGAGGNGGDVIVAGDLISFIRPVLGGTILNQAGTSGDRGEGGGRGIGGNPGLGGFETSYCKGGNPGVRGSDGAYGNAGPPNGNAGVKGLVHQSVLLNLDTLF